MIFISKKKRRETWFFYLFLLTLLKRGFVPMFFLLLCVGLLFNLDITFYSRSF